MFCFRGFFFLTIAFLGCASPGNIKETTTQVVESQSDPNVDKLDDAKTKKVTLANFTIELRDSMKEVKLTTIDSDVWTFRDNEMTVAVEQGIYNGPLQRDSGDLDFLEFQKVIDGEECKVTTLRFADTSNNKEPEKRYNLNARFNESNRVGDPLSIFIYYKNSESKQIALDIIESIRFSVFDHKK